MSEKREKRKMQIKKIMSPIIKLLNEIKKRDYYKVILLFICISIVASCFTIFRNSMQKKINNNTKNYLTSVINESLDRVSIKMNEEFRVLDTIGIIISGSDTYDGVMVTNLLKNQMEKNNFVGMSIYSKKAELVVKIGTTGLYVERECVREALEGKNSISSIYYDEINDKEYLVLSVPIKKANEIDAVLLCNYELTEFTEIVGSSHFAKVGTTFIAQEDGSLICRPESFEPKSNLYTLLDSFESSDEITIKKLKKCIKNSESGIITYGQGKHKRYICYSPIPQTDWYSISIVSASAIEPVAKKISDLAMYLAIQITCVFIVYVIIVLWVDHKTKKKRHL